MWIMLNDAFLSVVKKDCKDDELLVRARRPGDIEKIFGREVTVMRSLDSDYLFRSVIKRDVVTRAIQNEVLRIDYGNFKNSVEDTELHDAYLRVWTAMANLQTPRPYSQAYASKSGMATWTPGVPFVEGTKITKKNSKQARKKAERLIRKNGASIGTEPKERD